MARAQHVPFLVATLEPIQDQSGHLRAVPAVASLRLDDPNSKILIEALMRHLHDAGAMEVIRPSTPRPDPAEPQEDEG